jgi:hypothetical protein
MENAQQAERIERIDTKPKSSSSSSNETKTATFFEKDSAPQACKNLTDSNTKSRSVQEIQKRNFKKALNLENCQGLRNPEPPDCISQ